MQWSALPAPLSAAVRSFYEQAICALSKTLVSADTGAPEPQSTAAAAAEPKRRPALQAFSGREHLPAETIPLLNVAHIMFLIYRIRVFSW